MEYCGRRCRHTVAAAVSCCHFRQKCLKPGRHSS
ncbi:hypothetical protein [Epibacterium sp. Ofav1-8]